jgi:hypothetical protein
MSKLLNIVFLIGVFLALSVYSSNSFISKRVLQETSTQQESDEAHFGMLSFKSFLTHNKFSVSKVNEESGESIYVVSNQCSSKDSNEADIILSSCSIMSMFNNQNSKKTVQQNLRLNGETAYELDTNNSTLKIKGVESIIINKENGNVVAEKKCHADISYSFVNAKAQKPFSYASDKIEDLAVQIKISGGNCNADNVTPLLSLEAQKPDPVKVYAYIAVMIVLGLIQTVASGILVIQIDRNNNYAKQASMGTLCFLISFNFFIYLQHFTYWAAISNLMIIVFVLFFMLSVFFQPALLYFVFSTLQSRHNLPIRSLLFQLYFWLAFSALGIMISKTYLSEYILYTVPLCLVPQIFESMYNKQKYRWNYCLLGGLFLPNMVYLAISSLNVFNIFHAKANPNILVFGATAVAVQLVVLKIQTRFPGLGIVKKSNKNQYNYECQKDECESVSTVICSICTEQLGMNPLNGEQPGQDQEDVPSQPIMKTPCEHHFHESCLKEWFKKKFECPNCRQIVPPLDMDDDDE